jgi:hypothetical protein
MSETLDTRCSEACTRAGTFALLLSAIAISLLSPLVAEYRRTALQNYIGLRVALKGEVDHISANPCWLKLSEQLGGMHVTKTLTLTELGKYQCKEQSRPDGTEPELSVQASATTPQKRAYLTWDLPEPQTKKGLPPNPVRNLRIISEYSLPHLNPITKILTQLDENLDVNAARQFSLKFNNSIDRWTTKLYRMESRNASSEYPSAFTLVDIEELSNFELPDAVAYEELRLGQPTIQTPGISYQVQLEAGSVLLEIAVLLTVIYFWIFYEEARVSSTFPAPGSLFAAFGRRPASRLLFYILIAVPGICSLILAIWLSVYSSSPYMKLTLVPALLTICLTLAILKSSLSISTHSVRVVITKVFRRTKG